MRSKEPEDLRYATLDFGLRAHTAAIPAFGVSLSGESSIDNPKPVIVTADCSSTMKVRGFTKEDLTPILAIQAACAQAARWVEADYLHLADDPGGLILVAELETPTALRVLGFAALHCVMDVAELMNMAVDPEHQRQGIGRALLEAAWQRLRGVGTKQVFLEVRPSNKAALQFYFPLGFRLHSVRKDYYSDPPEDACVLALELLPPEAMGTIA